MTRPACPEHEGSKVWRDGHYGEKGQYQRWRCVPRNGARPHRFRPVLPPRSVGGAEGGCIECGRAWEPGDGMPTAVDDRYSLREKAAGLMALSEGRSYRSAGAAIRRRAGFLRPDKSGTPRPSFDGRLTRDWISHYTTALADEYLPNQWPSVLLLDHVPFHVRAKTPNGQPIPSGRLAFTVLAALSYGDGSIKAARSQQRRPLLWRLRAEVGSGEAQWRRFLLSLPGEPKYVVCDRQRSLINAIRRVWPRTAIYPCTHHLMKNLAQILHKGGLRGSTLDRLTHARTFADPVAYGDLLDGLEAMKDVAGGMTREESKTVGQVEDWLAAVNDDVVRSLENDHQPLSTGGLEQPLREIKNALFDRRALFKNLDRLDDLLVLLQLRQRQVADERQWAEILRRIHLQTNGKLPGRRDVDTSPRRAR